MKKKLLFVAMLIIIGSSITKAQQLNYQGIARNANGVAISFQDISIRLSIKDISASGATLYSETRLVRTNQFGLINLVIGSPGATSTIGSIGSINWASNSKFLQVEIDPAGGTNFLNAGTSQLQSVPYAFFATAAYPVGPAGGDLLGSTYPNPIIATFAVTTNKLNDEAVTNEKIKNAAINNAKIADATIENIKLVNSSITLNGLVLDLGSSQSFAIGNSGVDFNISSLGSVHTFNLPSASSTVRGLLSTTNFTNFNTAYINRITSLTTLGPNGPATLAANILNIPTYTLPAATATTLGGTIIGANITNTTGTISLNSSNITSALGGSQLANLVFASPNGAAGIPTFRALVGTDIPILNQNTTGSAATLTTARLIYGNTFNGSADITGIIGSNFGGTGNGFTKFTGPITSEKTFTLPNVNATILTSNAAVTIAQGGTGATAKPFAFDALSPMTSLGDIIYGGAAGTGTRLATGTNGQILTLTAGLIPSWATPASNNQWSILGNNGLVDGTNFLGTIDQRALRFRAFNLWAGELNPITSNTSFGIGAGQNNSSSINNTNNAAFGVGALNLNTSNGVDNTAIGQGALQNNTTGDNNTAIGQGAITTNSIANNNTSVGQAALRLATVGDNTAVGRAALENTSIGTGNTAVGYLALQINTTGVNNTAIGNGATANASGLSNSTAIGNGAIVNANNTVQLGNTSVLLVNTSGRVAANKFVGNSSTPTITNPTSVAGTTPTTNLVGNDAAGFITFTVGTGPSASGGIGSALFELSFTSAYTVAPVILVNVIKTNGVGSGVSNDIYVQPSLTETGKFYLTLKPSFTLTNGDIYQIAYHVLGR